jgi:iron(III) transport system substrate-binding protein
MDDRVRGWRTCGPTLALALCAACSGAGSSAPGSGWADLTVYAAQGAEITTPLLDAFARRYPGRRVEVIRAGTGEMLARIRAEKDNPRGDVLWGGSAEMYAANADLFAPVDLAEAEAFEAADPARLWHPFTTNLIHLVAHTERLSGPPPASFRELCDPRWSAMGGIAFANPGASGTGYSVVTALVTALGWDFLPALLRSARLTDSSDSMFRWVKDGETPLGFQFEATLRDYQAAGAHLVAVLATEGLIEQTDGFGLISGARNPDAARELMAFLAGAEAHEVVRAVIGRRSARRGVAPAPGLIDVEGRRLIRPDPRWTGRARADILARFDLARAEAGR